MVGLMALIMLLCACTRVDASTCMASWYGTQHGQHVTATGERYTGGLLTCALRSRPHNEIYRVTYRGKSVNCRHNDYGPAAWTGRCIDLSRRTARVLGFRGIGIVRIEKSG